MQLRRSPGKAGVTTETPVGPQGQPERNAGGKKKKRASHVPSLLRRGIRSAYIPKAHQGILPFKRCGHGVGADPGGSRRWGSASVEGAFIIQASLMKAVDGGETRPEALPQSQGPRDQTVGA